MRARTSVLTNILSPLSPDIDVRYLSSTARIHGYVYIEEMVSYIIRLIPQVTVDNNLGPDHLARPKALYRNYCRQTTL